MLVVVNIYEQEDMDCFSEKGNMAPKQAGSLQMYIVLASTECLWNMALSSQIQQNVKIQVCQKAKH